MQNAEFKMENEKNEDIHEQTRNDECEVENEENEDIQERTLEFACEIVQLYEKLQKNRGAARALSSQILRSGTSIGANMHEADAAQSKADFICKCRIALKEARETQYWLRVLKRSTIHVTDELINEVSELVAIVTTIVKNARQSKRVT